MHTETITSSTLETSESLWQNFLMREDIQTKYIAPIMLTGLKDAVIRQDEIVLSRENVTTEINRLETEQKNLEERVQEGRNILQEILSNGQKLSKILAEDSAGTGWNAVAESLIRLDTERLNTRKSIDVADAKRGEKTKQIDRLKTSLANTDKEYRQVTGKIKNYLRTIRTHIAAVQATIGDRTDTILRGTETAQQKQENLPILTQIAPTHNTETPIAAETIHVETVHVGKKRPETADTPVKKSQARNSKATPTKNPQATQDGATQTVPTDSNDTNTTDSILDAIEEI